MRSFALITEPCIRQRMHACRREVFKRTFHSGRNFPASSIQSSPRAFGDALRHPPMETNILVSFSGEQSLAMKPAENFSDLFAPFAPLRDTLSVQDRNVKFPIQIHLRSEFSNLISLTSEITNQVLDGSPEPVEGHGSPFDYSVIDS